MNGNKARTLGILFISMHFHVDGHVVFVMSPYDGDLLMYEKLKLLALNLFIASQSEPIASHWIYSSGSCIAFRSNES